MKKYRSKLWMINSVQLFQTTPLYHGRNAESIPLNWKSLEHSGRSKWRQSHSSAGCHACALCGVSGQDGSRRARPGSGDIGNAASSSAAGHPDGVAAGLANAVSDHSEQPGIGRSKQEEGSKESDGSLEF